ncbi:MAG: hypothetical protein IKG18_06415 [Atopobiaceae bacterium]|nr:hypothetical protein [Atopobiaceae bacterium]
MTNATRCLGSMLLAISLAATLSSCGQPEATGTDTDKTDEQEVTEVQTTEVVSRETEAPDAGGRIDVTQTGAQLATFEGDKYIVSDATVDQTKGEAYGLQEICVIRQPEAWNTAESIGWDRNSITYNNIATDWGKMSYRFEYINEAGSDTLGAAWSRSTEEGFFGEGVDISHASIAGHDVAYVINDDAAYEIALGIKDLEAQAEQLSQSNKFISVHAWESRGEACAFAATISCEVNTDAEAAIDAEQLLSDAYAALEFVEGSTDNVKAASHKSDLTISSADGTKQAIIKRNGATLMSYTRNSVALSKSEEGVGYTNLTIDFAPEGGLEAMPEVTASTERYDAAYGYVDVEASDVEQYEVDGLTVNARVVTATFDMGEQGQSSSSELRAWCDIDGNALYLETPMQEGEDVESALARTLKGRVELA